MYRRILVPVDGSATAERGLKEAVALAKTCNASLVLLHVTENYPTAPDMAAAAAWQQVMAGLREQGRDLLERAHQATLEAHVASEARLEDAAASRVCDVIVDQARERHCDLIVMGAHGRGALAELLLGSIATRVVHLARMPVLLVK